MADTAPVDPNFAGFDDETREAGRNGWLTNGPLMASFANALNSIAHGPRIIYTFWGGVTSDTNATIRRFFWNKNHVPGRRLSFSMLWVPPNGPRQSGQGVSFAGYTNSTNVLLDYTAYTTAGGLGSPEGDKTMTLSFNAVGSAETSGTIASASTNGPGIISGIVYEPRKSAADPTTELDYVPPEQFAVGNDILAVAPTGVLGHINTYRKNLNHTWNRLRPEIGWSAAKPDVNALAISDSQEEFRYIMDQTVGDGGTAPSATGPAITIPLYKAGSGLETTVRVRIMIRAAMTGTTDTGTIGVSHRDGAGGMTAIAAVSGIAVTGTTYDTYGGFVTLRTDLAYERVVLCAKSDGATDYMIIAAWSMYPLPTTSIT